MSFDPLLTVLAAVEQTRSESVLEFDLPSSAGGRFAFFGGFALTLILVVFMYLRDTRSFSWPVRSWLLLLRVATVIAIFVIMTNPSRRTPEMMYRPSQVAVLVDTSLSMGYPEGELTNADSSSAPTRADAVRRLLENSELVDELSKDHQVSVYSFDSQLSGPHAVIPYRGRLETAETNAVAGEDPEPAEVITDWNEILRPRGLDTRLGDSLRALIGKVRSKSLSGIVVLSDGGSNAGFHPDAAHDVAVSSGLRLISVGLGGTEKQKNLQLVSLQAPSDVQVGDAFELKALVQGQGFAGQSVTIDLLSRDEGDQAAEPTLLLSRDLTLLEDGVPAEVVFQQTPTVAGKVEYFARVKPANRIPEWSETDNERRKSVNLNDRKMRILLIAGGPAREYRFVRNLLYRHPALLVDVWLQSVDAASFARVSQESDQMLTEFPGDLGALDEYDVIVGFDPDWSQITSEQREILLKWVSQRSGGVIVLPGDIYTPQLAAGGEEMAGIRELYPVFLSEFVLGGLSLDQEAKLPYEIAFTREGLDSEFLQLAEGADAVAEGTGWGRFSGVYRAYPTAGAKAGAMIYAYFADVRAQTEHGQPVLMASQFFGSGRTFFLGTAEFWRLRAISEEYYERFWTKLIREVGKGRRQRGTSRGLLMLERTEYALGQTVRLRARLYDKQLNELDLPSVPVSIINPQERPLVPERKLVQDPNNKGQYIGDFRANQVGTWQIELAIPDAKGEIDGDADQLIARLDVVLPNLEADHPEQDVALLKNLVRDTGGSYLTSDEAATKIPELLMNKGEQFVVNEWPETLWDRSWVLYVLVGLLSAEWLTRKLLKLA